MATTVLPLALADATYVPGYGHGPSEFLCSTRCTYLNTGDSSDVTPVTTLVMSILHTLSRPYIMCLICVEHLSSDPISATLFIMSTQQSLSWPYGCAIQSG